MESSKKMDDTIELAKKLDEIKNAFEKILLEKKKI